MKYARMTAPERAERSILARLEAGDEILSSIRELARKESIPSAFLWCLGAVNDITLAFYDLGTRRYEETPLAQELEVASMTGNISWLGDDPVVHLHGVVSRRDGSTAAGHVMRGIVSVTLEVMVLVHAERVERRNVPSVGLNLLDLG